MRAGRHGSAWRALEWLGLVFGGVFLGERYKGKEGE